jgi:phosphoglycerate dehydrogenase-like enzyme
VSDLTPGGGTGPAAIAISPILSVRYRPRDLERIAAAAPGARIVSVSRDGHADGPLDDVEVLLHGSVGREALERLVGRTPRLRWIHSASAGVERVIAVGRARPGLVITNARGVFSRPIAEYVAMMVLAVSRRLPQLLELQRERTWQPLEGREMRDVTVGVVGLGSIGTAVAELAAGMGCRVVATRRHPEAGEPVPGVEVVGGPESLPVLLAASDFVVLALPLTPDTEGIIGPHELAAMRPGAWLINVARGRLVDDHALTRALREGRIGGAVLDSFREEPLSGTSPYYDLPNVIVTPHTSWSSSRVLDRTIELFCDNLVRLRRGEPLANRVDADAGY